MPAIYLFSAISDVPERASSVLRRSASCQGSSQAPVEPKARPTSTVEGEDIE